MHKSRKRITTKNRRHFKKLIEDLGAESGMKRQEARKTLVEKGKVAVPFLSAALSNPDKHVRWEAAKAFVNIKDPSAAPVLVSSLRDHSSEVRWLAAEALIALGASAVEPLLRGLELYTNENCFYQAAHHVLSSLKKENLLNDISLQLLRNLHKVDRYVTVPVLAHKALNALKAHEGLS